MSTVSVRVDAADQTGEARRAASAMARHLEFDESEVSRVALIVTECATNLWKHAGGGEILLCAAVSPTKRGVEILALDKGPGMRDIALCFQDGYSTAGSPGTGLGAIRRLSSHFDVYSQERKGSALLARFWKEHRALSPRESVVEAGGVSVPMPGEQACGDGYAVKHGASACTVLVVDGLGHGPAAAACATQAIVAFHDLPEEEPERILQAVHHALRPTRGAAVSVVRLDAERREVRYAGIGNIAGLIFDENGQSRHMASLPGIAGHDVRNVREFTYPWMPESLVLLYSDGITSHWSPASYVGLFARDASLIAGVLYRDWTRGRDDSTVLVLRQRFLQ